MTFCLDILSSTCELTKLNPTSEAFDAPDADPVCPKLFLATLPGKRLLASHYLLCLTLQNKKNVACPTDAETMLPFC